MDDGNELLAPGVKENRTSVELYSQSERLFAPTANQEAQSHVATLAVLYNTQGVRCLFWDGRLLHDPSNRSRATWAGWAVVNSQPIKGGLNVSTGLQNGRSG